MSRKITGEELGGLLFGIHDHIWDDENSDQNTPTVYHEEDILELFRKIGLPEVVWGGFIRLKTFSLDPEERKKNEEEYKRENPNHAI